MFDRSLPGKSDQNPKEAKAITLRSGKQLPPRTLTKDAEKLGEGVAINIDDEVVIVDEKIITWTGSTATVGCQKPMVCPKMP